MARFEVVKDGLLNVILAEDEAWVAENFPQYTKLPEPIREPIRLTLISKLEFMSRFTDEELEALYAARRASVKIEVWMAKFDASSQIDLDDPRLRSGLLAMQSLGILAHGRADELLTAEVV